MKLNFTIKIACDNPEFEQEALKDGRKVDGFLLLTNKGGKPDMTALGGISVMDLVDIFMENDQTISMLRQAAVISEAKRNAWKIRNEMKDADGKDMMLRSILEALRETGEQNREREE